MITPNGTQSATTVAAEDLAAATIATAPEPTGAKPPAATPETATMPAAPVEKDSLGREFDPAKFKREKDSLGRWKNLNSGRRSTGVPSDPQKLATAGTPEDDPTGLAARHPASSSFVAPDAPAPKGPDKYDLAADMYCRAFYVTADSVFAGRGEWAPDNDAEHIGLRDATAAYMRAKGMDDLPPGPALLLAVVTYSAKRVQRPNTSTRFRLFVDHLRARFASWRTGRKIAAQPAP